MYDGARPRPRHPIGWSPQVEVRPRLLAAAGGGGGGPLVLIGRQSVTSCREHLSWLLHMWTRRTRASSAFVHSFPVTTTPNTRAFITYLCLSLH